MKAGENSAFELLGLSSTNVKTRRPLAKDTVETQDIFPGTLHGVQPCGKGTHQERKYEQFWHKSAAVLYATGHTDEQVADAVGKDRDTVRQVRRTSWFQEMVSKVVADNGGRDMIELFKKDAVAARDVLVEILENEKAPLALKAKVATDMVERVYGKATQRVEHGTIASADPVAEAEELSRQLENLRQAQSPSLS